MDEQITLTMDLINAGANHRNGYKQKQIRLLGAEVNPKTGWPKPGWKRDMIGKKISAEVYRQFLALKDQISSAPSLFE